MTSREAARFAVAAFLIAATVSLPARQVRTGAPPEIRALVDAVVQAVNSGSPEAWEAFAQARYAPSLLQKQTRDQRAEQYRQIADRFGTVAMEQVRREGPEAPLQINVKGTKGSGVIEVDVDGGATPRILSLSAT